MKVLTCAATRRRLHAYHDEELPVSDQIAVASHLEWCDGCAAALTDLRALRQILRAAMPGRAALANGDSVNLQGAVVERLRTERQFSISETIRELAADSHFLFSSLMAAAAMIVCVVSLFSIVRFAATVRPDSLAAMMNAVPPPGSNENPVSIDAYVLMPRALDQAFSTITDFGDADGEFMFVAVVTREGTISNLELHRATSSKEAENLMGAVSQARFEPARVDGLPVAVNMVWLVTSTTVRASGHNLDRHPAAAKKRVA